MGKDGVNDCMCGGEVAVDGQVDMGKDGMNDCMCGGELAVGGQVDMGKDGVNGCMCGVEVAVDGRGDMGKDGVNDCMCGVTYQRDFTVIPIPPIPPILYGFINQTDTQLRVGKNFSPTSHPHLTQDFRQVPFFQVLYKKALCR